MLVGGWISLARLQQTAGGGSPRAVTAVALASWGRRAAPKSGIGPQHAHGQKVGLTTAGAALPAGAGIMSSGAVRRWFLAVATLP